MLERCTHYLIALYWGVKYCAMIHSHTHYIVGLIVRDSAYMCAVP